MIKRFLYGSSRTLGTLMITFYAVGILPASFSSGCSNDSAQSNNIYMGSELSSISKADAWINSNGLTATELKGKVVLVEFCTYTCINWLRTMPYVRAWSEKYKKDGLVVIGVHTPEFPFEKNIDNVRNSTRFVENGSYFRIKSATLAYNFSGSLLKNAGLKRTTLYVTAQNLLTITNYKGFDPEVNTYGVNSRGTEFGVDYGTYPQTRQIVFGLNLDF